MRPLPTLLALTLAAAFGGFAATAIRDGLETPAQAAPGRRRPRPAVAALPAVVSGQPLPSLAPMLAQGHPGGGQRAHQADGCGSARSATTRCSGACFPN